MRTITRSAISKSGIPKGVSLVVERDGDALGVLLDLSTLDDVARSRITALLPNNPRAALSALLDSLGV